VLCREPERGHSAKKLQKKEKTLWRVPNSWHSVKSHGRVTTVRGDGLCREPGTRHRGFLPSAMPAECLALSKAIFAECLDLPRAVFGIEALCQVSDKRHSAKCLVLGNVPVSRSVASQLKRGEPSTTIKGVQKFYIQTKQCHLVNIFRLANVRFKFLTDNTTSKTIRPAVY
jgi:hypothetical protein